MSVISFLSRLGSPSQYYSSLLVFIFLYRTYTILLLLPRSVMGLGCLCAIFCSVALSKIQSQLRVHFNTFVGCNVELCAFLSVPIDVSFFFLPPLGLSGKSLSRILMKISDFTFWLTGNSQRASSVQYSFFFSSFRFALHIKPQKCYNSRSSSLWEGFFL